MIEQAKFEHDEIDLDDFIILENFKVDIILKIILLEKILMLLIMVQNFLEKYNLVK